MTHSGGEDCGRCTFREPLKYRVGMTDPQLGLRFGLSDVPRRFAFTLDWKDLNPGDTVNPQGMQMARGLPEVASSKDLSSETSQEPFYRFARKTSGDLETPHSGWTPVLFGAHAAARGWSEDLYPTGHTCLVCWF